MASFFEKCLQIVWIGIGIAMIVVGALYINECPSRPYLPIYVVINGVMHLVPILMFLLIALLEKRCIISEMWAIIPNYIWFVIGTPFVFKTDDDDDTEAFLCDPNLYMFTLGILTVDCVIYIMIVLYWYYGSRIRAFCYEHCGCYERTSMMEVPSRNSDGEEILTSSESSVDDTSGTASSHIFCLVIWIAFSIAMIVIGSLYIHECATEPKIPIYLIVAGTVNLFGIVLLMLKLLALKLIFCLEVVLCLFSFSWFTAGSIWVFTIYQDDSKDCNEIVFDFAFGALIFQYIFLAFISVFFCLCSCCVGFLAAKVAIQIDMEKAPLSPEQF